MSGYRTLHRIQPQSPPQSSWHVRFSPCRPPPSAHPSSQRLFTSGASNHIRAYSLRERTKEDVDENSLDTTPLVVECTEYLVPSDYNEVNPSLDRGALGYGALDVTRNYCGADTSAGHEVVMASQLGGRVGVWVRLDPALHGKKSETETTITTTDENGKEIKCIKPDVEFTVPKATGTTLAIRPPTLANYYSKHERNILIALGCANGSVILCRSGIISAKPGESTTSSGTVGDSSTNTNEIIHVKSESTPGEIISTIGKGHACVLSIVWHPSIPNTFAVGRKDGSIDIYSSTSQYDEASFRRVHRLTDAAKPIRALSFSQPEGCLLFSGDDGGKLYSYDASVMSSSFIEHKDSSKAMSCPIKLVACALNAHKGWVMNITSFPDEKRICSCGSDRSVKVWDCGMGFGSSMPVHSFDGVHGGWVWDVACRSVGGGASVGGGKKMMLVSCGNDGVLQVYSCGE